jgi:hypothetical protein
MGLIMEVYQFRGQLPALEQVEAKVCELTNEQVETKGTFGPSPGDETEARLVGDSGMSILLRSTSVTFRNSGDTRRGARDVHLTVSLDGSKIVLSGNNIHLFEALSEALSYLGGTVHHPRAKN